MFQAHISLSAEQDSHLTYLNACDKLLLQAAASIIDIDNHLPHLAKLDALLSSWSF